jgi:hypothetical protein
MREYGISKIRLDAARAEVDEVLLHEIVRRSPGTDEIGTNEGTKVSYQEVAKLIQNDAFVWILVDDGPDSFAHTDSVELKAPDNQRIGSFNLNGDPTRSLYELPQF